MHSPRRHRATRLGSFRRYLALQRAAGEFGFGASLTTHVEAGAAVVGEGQSGEPWVAAGCLGHFERTPDAASGDGDDWGGADADGLYEEARCASPWVPCRFESRPSPGRAAQATPSGEGRRCSVNVRGRVGPCGNSQ